MPGLLLLAVIEAQLVSHINEVNQWLLAVIVAWIFMSREARGAILR